MRTKHNRLLLAVVAVAALAAVACTGDDPERADTESIDSSSPQGAAGDGGSATGDDTDEGGNGDNGDGDGGGSSGIGEVLGTARASLPANAIDNRSTPLRLDVVRLERHGDLVELSMVLTNEAEVVEGEDPQDFQLNTMWGDGGGVDARYDASGIALVDGEGQKLYLPVLDSGGTCLCSGDYGAIETPPGGTLNVDATFGGVPDDVEALDVRVPNFPVIAGVPVS